MKFYKKPAIYFNKLKIDDRNVSQPCLKITFVLVHGGLLLNILNDQFIFHKVTYQIFWKIHYLHDLDFREELFTPYSGLCVLKDFQNSREKYFIIC